MTIRPRHSSKHTYVDMSYFAARNNPARTYPMAADPTTAPPNARTAKQITTMSANVSRERRSFCFAGERDGTWNWLRLCVWAPSPWNRLSGKLSLSVPLRLEDPKRDICGRALSPLRSGLRGGKDRLKKAYTPQTTNAGT